MSSKSGGRKKSQNEYSVIADNRKATFQYEIEDTFEAGIVLTGSEITISFAGGNQPNAKFPNMIKRNEGWNITHDFKF